jgi:hypothetical protein
MAKVKLNPMIQEVRGKAGDLVFRTTANGKTSLIKRANMSHVEWSDAQKEHRQRMKAAVAYAHAAKANPAVWQQYQQEAAKENKKPFNLAISDYFKGRIRL